MLQLFPSFVEKKNMNAQGYRTILYFILLATACALGGYWIGYFVKHNQTMVRVFGDFQWSVWHLLSLSMLYFLALGMHEMGHFLAGWAQGFRFDLFVLGFLWIKRTDSGKIVCYFNLDWQTFGGMVSMSPLKDSPDMTVRMARMVLAGPLFSGVLGLLCLGLCWFLPPNLFFLSFCLGLFSFAVLIVTTLPSRTGGFYTDRKRYQRLTGKGPEAEIEQAVARANALKMSGASLKEMPEEELAKITHDKSPIFRLLGYVYLYEYHLGDEVRTTNIQQEIIKLKQSTPKVVYEAVVQGMVDLKQGDPVKG
jgi:Peptidase family M50